MNQCQVCHERDAVVRLTQIVGDEVTTVHLCSQCAADRGIETDTGVAQTPLGAFLAAMGKGSQAVATTSADAEACSECGATLQDFRASGRVGCSRCWTTFELPLRDLLRRLHGATRHSGEQYRPVDVSTLSAVDLQQRNRSELRDALRQAIEAEQFERAAELRDQLRVLDTS